MKKINNIEPPFEVNEQQRISLSRHAAEILENDCHNFHCVNGDSMAYTTFINTVFLKCCQDTVADHENVKELLKAKTASSYIVSLRKETRELLESDETWRRDVLYRTNGKPKGKPRPSKYIRAVIEEYAQKPNLERQKIYFKDIIKQLSDSIANKSIIVFKRDDHINKLIPIKIACDKHEMHLYLAGISIYTDKDDEKEKLGTTVSHRIDKINGKIALLPLTTVPAEKKEIDIKRKQVYDDIRNKGIEFLVSDIDEIKVRLTKRGKKNYNQWLFQRPKYSKKEGDDIYVFNVSKYQIIVYFFKFGEDAEIIEPYDLREEFAKKYSNAAKIYQKSC